MNYNLSNIIDQTNAKPSGDGFIGHCPAHDDKNPSFYFSEKDGKFLCHCFAGCTYKEIAQKLNQDYAPRGYRDPSNKYLENLWYEAIEFGESTNPAKAYLTKVRGIEIKDFEVYRNQLRYHPHIYHTKCKKYFCGLLVAIRDSEGVLTGIQRIYLNSDGTKAEVEDQKMIIGKYAGSSFCIGDPKVQVAICEGPETAIAVHEATGLPVICAISAPNLKASVVPPTVSKAHLFADKDVSGTGERHARKLRDELASLQIESHIHLPDLPIPEDKKGVDWLDEYEASGPEPLLECLSQANAKKPSSPWPEIVELPPFMPKAPEMPHNMLIPAIKSFILDGAERMNVPPEFVAVPLICSASSVIGRQVGIRPKSNDTQWVVTPNLWGAIVGKPSAMKTPSMEYGQIPLNHIIREEKTRVAEKEKVCAPERKKFEVIVKAADKKLESLVLEQADRLLRPKNADDKKVSVIKNRVHLARGSASTDLEIAELQETRGQYAAQLAELFVGERRFKTNDATVEKIGELLRDNAYGMMMVRDELSGFLKTLTKTGREGDREFFLEAWSGNGSYLVDRIGRGTIDIPSLCLSIFGGIQPGKLEALVKDALSHGRGDDGLLQRFQLMVYPETASSWKSIDREPDKAACDRLKKIFSRLTCCQNLISIPIEIDGEMPSLNFSPEAQKVFDAWREQFENRLIGLREESEAFESHLAKYRKLLPALALVFELINAADFEDPIKEVSVRSLNPALIWCDFLEKHAEKVYAIARNPSLRSAHALLQKIQQKKVCDGMQLRQIYRKRLAIHIDQSLKISNTVPS